jgi:uncharacterized protein YaeQ
MALKAIIYRTNVNVSDLDNNLYHDLSFTIARHPSETEERMMLRLLAYVLNVPSNNDFGSLEFAGDMWEADEPALRQTDLTGLLMHEIELGQPEEKRLVRACGRAKRVSVYTYTHTSTAWWNSVMNKLSRVNNLHVWHYPVEQIHALGSLADRSMNLQVTIQDGILWISEGEKSVELTPTCLFPNR